MASSAKQRQPRLRASCDGCFLAKVKCSKARPICSRCLACGIECRYSPSSRAGKPKADNSNNQSSPAAEMNSLSTMPVEKNFIIPSHSQNLPPGMYKIETGWHTPPNVEGGMSRTQSVSSAMALLGVDEGTNAPVMAAEMYSTTIPWTPPNDLVSAPSAEASLAAPLASHVRSQSYDFPMSTSPTSAWTDPSAVDFFSSGQGQIHTPGSMSSSFFPSPVATPNLRPAPRHKSASTGGSSSSQSSCTCFTVCLQSLQALHNASSPATPPFDLVLSLNRKAVEGCAAMLSCPRCMSRSGTHTAAMLLGTVMGKITSFYKNASQSHFENGGMTVGTGISLGAYQVHGEDGRWLEIEILARELRKLEEVYAQYREVCGELSEDPEVSRAVVGYLGHTLGSTLDVVTHHKGDFTFA